MCSTCGKDVLLDGLCVRHLKQTCNICFDPVGSTNTIKSKRLACGHSFHPECILKWFVTSNECPTCRMKQDGDVFIEFKDAVEEELRIKFRDYTNSLENEIKGLKETLRLQTMFRAFMPLPSDMSVSVHFEVEETDGEVEGFMV